GYLKRRSRLLTCLLRPWESEDCLLSALTTVEQQGAQLFGPAIAVELAPLWEKHSAASSPCNLQILRVQSEQPTYPPGGAERKSARGCMPGFCRDRECILEQSLCLKMLATQCKAQCQIGRRTDRLQDLEVFRRIARGNCRTRAQQPIQGGRQLTLMHCHDA